MYALSHTGKMTLGKIWHVVKNTCCHTLPLTHSVGHCEYKKGVMDCIQFIIFPINVIFNLKSCPCLFKRFWDKIHSPRSVPVFLVINSVFVLSLHHSLTRKHCPKKHKKKDPPDFAKSDC